MEASLLFHRGEEKGLLWKFLHGSSPSPPLKHVDRSACSALDIRGLTFSYGQTRILDDVSLSVKSGEICGLLGPNGSGKSTLFRCCMGFLHPEQGQVQVHGVNIAHMKPSTLAGYVAYVPQEHRQPFPFTVREMVLMGRTPRMSGWFRLNRRDERIAEEALDRIGIAHLADQPCSQLSGGQRQLVLIARAMAQQTPLILLDEPTSALDFSNQLAVWNVLQEVAAKGVAVLVCCHDPNHILWFCDRAAVMHEGRICATGGSAEVITEDVLQRIYGPQCVRISTGENIMVCPRQAAR